MTLFLLIPRLWQTHQPTIARTGPQGICFPSHNIVMKSGICLELNFLYNLSVQIELEAFRHNKAIMGSNVYLSFDLAKT